MRGRRAVHHPVFARWIYPRVLDAAERRGASEHRKELLAGLCGRVIEVGAGNGANFRHYPPSVLEVVATEPESHLRPQAICAAPAAPAAVQVVDAAAEALPMESSSFDGGSPRWFSARWAIRRARWRSSSA